jgi:hypothetical protein
MTASQSVKTITHGGARDVQDCARVAIGIG